MCMHLLMCVCVCVCLCVCVTVFFFSTLHCYLKFLSCLVAAVIKSQRNHTVVYFNYKLIGLVSQTSY